MKKFLKSSGKKTKFEFEVKLVYAKLECEKKFDGEKLFIQWKNKNGDTSTDSIKPTVQSIGNQWTYQVDYDYTFKCHTDMTHIAPKASGDSQFAGKPLKFTLEEGGATKSKTVGSFTLDFSNVTNHVEEGTWKTEILKGSWHGKSNGPRDQLSLNCSVQYIKSADRFGSKANFDDVQSITSEFDDSTRMGSMSLASIASHGHPRSSGSLNEKSLEARNSELEHQVNQLKQQINELKQSNDTTVANNRKESSQEAKKSAQKGFSGKTTFFQILYLLSIGSTIIFCNGGFKTGCHTIPLEKSSITLRNIDVNLVLASCFLSISLLLWAIRPTEKVGYGKLSLANTILALVCAYTCFQNGLIDVNQEPFLAGRRLLEEYEVMKAVHGFTETATPVIKEYVVLFNEQKDLLIEKIINVIQ